MTYVIGQPCIGTTDQSCVDVCPVDCIHATSQMLVISPSECIDCGACVAVCPVEAIQSDNELSPEWKPFVDINAAWDDEPERVEALLAQLAGVGGTTENG